MSRSLRVVEPNDIYHVSPRGNDGRVIFRMEGDRRHHVDLLTRVARRYRWSILGYCQMTTHYHAVIQLPELGLSEGMQQLQCQYSAYWNREHRRSGHLFRQHFDGRPVRSDRHLQVVLAYVDLNPLAIKGVNRPEQWRWSSYRAHVGREHPAPYLDLPSFHRLFGTTPDQACRVYKRLVHDALARVSDTRVKRRE